MSNFDYPGVKVTEATAGAVPIDRRSFRAIKLTGTALRGPAGLNLNPITREGMYGDIYGANDDSSFIDDAVRAIFGNTDTSLIYVNRVVGSGAVKASVKLVGGGTSQVETATVIGTIGAGGAGNVAVIVTAAGMTGSPKTIAVAVANNDTAAQVAGKIRAALAADAAVIALFEVSGSGANVILTRLVHAANDGTLNISIDNDTSTGLTAAPTSANTTAGVADVDVLTITSKGPGADYNYVASPAHGLSVTYISGILTIYDAGVAVETFRDVLFGRYSQSENEVNGGSNLVDIDWEVTNANPNDYSAAQGLLSGADGSAVTASDIAGDSEAKTGVYAYARKDLPLGFILAPGYPQLAVGNALIAVAEGWRQLALLDSTFSNSHSQAITERNQFAAPKGHAIYCYGWAKVRNEESALQKWVPRSAYRAAHIARSHSQPGFLANVGAGLEYTLRGILALETGDMDDLQQGELNVRGIDVARDFSAFGQGKVHWSARTISTNPLYRFLQVRVILNVLADSIEIGLRPYLFQTYDGKGRRAAEIKGSVDQLLWDLWNQDSLFGGTAGEAFLVKNVSTLSELEQGVIRLEVYVKPTPIIERIDVTLFRVPLNFNFTTGEVTIGNIEANA